MKKKYQRRSFLKSSFQAGAGLTLLSMAPETFYANDCPYDGYNPFAEEKADLRQSLFGKTVILKGKIFDEEGKLPLSNTTVEIWHLSPNSSKFRHRGKLITNKKGEYRFVTDYPNAEKGKTPRIFYKISKQSKTTFTELVFSEFGANITSQHWEKNYQLGNYRLFPKMKHTSNGFSIDFNISLK